MRPRLPEAKLTEQDLRARSEAELLRFNTTQEALRQQTRLYARQNVNRRSFLTGRPIRSLTNYVR